MSNKENKKIIFIHILNNFSGSPNVLSTVVEELYQYGYETTLVTSFINEGFLSNTSSSKKININYRFHENKIYRGLAFLKFQILSSLVIFNSTKNHIIYINTILPFLPAIIAKIKGMKVICHIHEAYPKKSFFHRALFYCIERTASKIVCVSEFVKNGLTKETEAKSIVVYNALNKSFTKNIIPRKKKNRRNILMVSSAKVYKGVLDFCELSKQLIEYNFVLVCDATSDEIDVFFSNYKNLSNLFIYPTQNNLHGFYSEADIILNLSNPKLIIETFGLTILEGMNYGLPAIVPPIGGISEIVDDNVNGLKIDVNDTQRLKNGIKSILDDKEKYDYMSKRALEKSKTFNLDKQISIILNEVL